MTTIPLARAALAALFLSLVNVATAAIDRAVEPVGDGSFRVTASANHLFTRNTAKLKAEATEAAQAFCAKAGKHLKVVSTEEHKSLLVGGDMTSVTLTFKALEQPEPDPARAGPAPEVAAAPITTEALYADLMRLDELRKKGILTDEEFAAEKKKVLARSK